MKDKDLEAQISDIIEGEIQNGINDYLEQQEEIDETRKETGLGFVKSEDEAKELKVNVRQDEVDKIIKEYKRIKKFKKSNLGQVQKLGLLDKNGRPL
tara:strand:+ start:169 stop:459 length:291 start_codon:yes stop_codon:yes gene_type:complete